MDFSSGMNGIAANTSNFHGYTPPTDQPAPPKEPPAEPITVANQPVPQGVASIAPAPQPIHIQNANPHSIPTANQPTPGQMTTPAANQNQLTADQAEQIKLMQTGQRMAQELNLLTSSITEQKFLEIAHSMEAHPISQHIHREMAETAVASMMGINFVVKAHIAHPEVPVVAFANDAMMLIGNFKYGQRPENGLAGLEQQFGIFSKHYGLDKVQLAPATAQKTPSLAPEGLAAASAQPAHRTPTVPASTGGNTLAADNNILAASAEHQGKVAGPAQQQIA